jgi:glucose/sorbosone dehydrogenase
MRRARALVVAALAAAAASVVTATATAAVLPAGFSESVALHGLDQPTVARFSPDGRVFVAEKSGVVEVFPSAGASTPTVFADLRNDVYDFWDRGLLGMALDPHFPIVPYVYVLYTYDHVLGDPAPAPRWSPGGSEPDACPDPPARPLSAASRADGWYASGRTGTSRRERRSSSRTGVSSSRATPSGRSLSARTACCMREGATPPPSTPPTRASSGIPAETRRAREGRSAARISGRPATPSVSTEP